MSTEAAATKAAAAQHNTYHTLLTNSRPLLNVFIIADIIKSTKQIDKVI